MIWPEADLIRARADRGWAFLRIQTGLMDLYSRPGIGPPTDPVRPDLFLKRARPA